MLGLVLLGEEIMFRFLGGLILGLGAGAYIGSAFAPALDKLGEILAWSSLVSLL
jgi:hypothetical protein